MKLEDMICKSRGGQASWRHPSGSDVQAERGYMYACAFRQRALYIWYVDISRPSVHQSPVTHSFWIPEFPLRTNAGSAGGIRWSESDDGVAASTRCYRWSEQSLSSGRGDRAVRLERHVYVHNHLRTSRWSSQKVPQPSL